MSRPQTVLPPALADAFAQRVDPVRTPPGYRAAAAATAVGMVLLPLLYIALVCAVIWAVLTYAVVGLGIFTVNVGWFTLLLYIAPLVIGVVVVISLVKPIFAKRRVKSEPVALIRQDEPVLYGFVDRLADALGAPRPVRIDVDGRANASARFRRGALSMATNDLVLTIGLPLAGDLSVRSLAGVLAHELGHFAQGGGMRLTYIVESVSRWFERVVTERDGFDDSLHDAAEGSGGWVGLVFTLALLAVAFGRGVLRVLMNVGRRLSRGLLRQMEFDADRYEVRVGGAAAFAETTDALVLLNAAEGAAFADLDVRIPTRRLPDDLPALVVLARSEMPPTVAEAILADARGAQTSSLDTHPATAERLASAKREGGAGLPFPDLPARDLFADFDDVCRRATAAFYAEALDVDIELVPTAALLADREAQTESFGALGRLTQGVGDLPILAPGALAPPADAGAALAEARDRVVALAPSARQATKRMDDAMGATLQAAAAAALVRGRVPIEPAEFGLEDATLATAQRRAAAADEERAAARESLEPFHDALRARIAAALALDAETHGAEPDDGLQTQLAALTAIDAERDVVRTIRIGRIQADVLVRHALAQPRQDVPSVQYVFNAAVDRTFNVRNHAVGLRSRLQHVPLPRELGAAGLTLGDVALAVMPPRAQVGDTLHALSVADEQLSRAYGQLWASLAARVERIETALGMPPLPDAPEPVETEAGANDEAEAPSADGLAEDQSSS